VAAFFQVLTEAVYNGKHKIDASQTEALCKPGRVAKLATDSELEVTDAGETAFGLMFGLHGEAYDRMRNDLKRKYTNFKAGDYITVIQGTFIGQANDECFDNSTLVAIGSAVYVGNSGFLSGTSSGTQIGKVIAQDSVRNTAGGTDTVDRIAFDIKGW
jgi:hypothetical protein